MLKWRLIAGRQIDQKKPAEIFSAGFLILMMNKHYGRPFNPVTLSDCTLASVVVHEFLVVEYLVRLSFHAVDQMGSCS